MDLGPKLVKNLFQLAEDNAPSIVFIDEVDAIGTKRNHASCSAEREVQRTLLELLNQLDGFESRQDVMVIMATNRIDTLDTALIRPGRIDRRVTLPTYLSSILWIHMAIYSTFVCLTAALSPPITFNR